jgi:mannose-6-phosphate isomerase
MANSDNVLRGGLTPKHIDIRELFRVLKFSPFKPEILKPPKDGSAADSGNSPYYYKYPAPVREFSLTVIGGGENRYAETGPSIIIVTEGELHIADSAKRNTAILKKGESAFIPAGSALRGLDFSGNYTAYTAGIGETEN